MQFGKFAGTFAELGSPTNGSSGPAAADLLPLGLATTGEGSGYWYAVALTTTGYIINAKPLAFGATGERTVFSDQSLTIHQRVGPDPAGATDPEVK